MTTNVYKVTERHNVLKVGTRTSPLALIQTKIFVKAFQQTYPGLPEDFLHIVPIKTTGDQITDKSLAEIGGKGLFTKELDKALCNGTIDIAIHSMKDVETFLSSEIAIGCVLEREDPRDAFISHTKTLFKDMPAGSIIGTASPRRQAQILFHRPDLQPKLIRGNVETRLQKVKDGLYDGTLLAIAGLKRLKLEVEATQIFEADDIIPAAGQGIIGACYHNLNSTMKDILDPINHMPTWQCLLAERSMLEALQGTCQTPIGAYAQILPDYSIHLTGMLADPCGHPMVKGAAQHMNAHALGQIVAKTLRDAFHV